MAAAVAKKREQQLKRYRQRIDSAQGFRKDEGLDDLWRRLNDLYRGHHFPKNLSADDQIAVNVCFATINVIGPSVAVNYPKITVTPTTPEQSDSAVILEAAANYWWKHYDALPEFQRGVKDFLIYGFGWMKNGWRFVEEDQDDPDGYQAAFEKARGEADDYAQANPHLAGSLPTDEELAANIPSTKRVTVHDAPFVERCSPHDIFVDPEATSMQDMRWIDQKVVKTYEEIKSSKVYKATAIKSCSPDGHVSDTWFQADPFRKGDADDIKRVTVWEFYDITNGTMCVFPATGDDFFVDPVEQPYSFGHPFTMLRNYDVPEQFYPMGELEALEPLQHELNLTRTQMFNDRKQYRRAWLVRMDSFGKAGRAAITDDTDNRLIPVEGQEPFEDIIAPLPSQQPNPQLYQDSGVIEHDIDSISGVSEYRAATNEVRRTATEAAILQDTANARAADKLARVEWAISNIARRMVQLAQQYMSEGQVARIMGANGRPFHFFFEPEDIQGEYDFDVVGGSTQPKNDMLRRQNAMQILQTLAPFGNPQMGLVDMRKLIAHTLRDGFGIQNPEEFLMPSAPGSNGMGMPPEMVAAMQKQQGGGAPPPPEQGPLPDQVTPDGGPQGGVPPEIMAQLAGQVGLGQ